MFFYLFAPGEEARHTQKYEHTHILSTVIHLQDWFDKYLHRDVKVGNQPVPNLDKGAAFRTTF